QLRGPPPPFTLSLHDALPISLIERFGPEAQTRLLAALTEFNITGWLRSLAGQASGLLSGSLLVILFVGFMFAERVWLPIKVERRSEEHTSELQSRFDLVCRLL